MFRPAARGPLDFITFAASGEARNLSSACAASGALDAALMAPGNAVPLLDVRRQRAGESAPATGRISLIWVTPRLSLAFGHHFGAAAVLGLGLHLVGDAEALEQALDIRRH